MDKKDTKVRKTPQFLTRKQSFELMTWLTTQASTNSKLNESMTMTLERANKELGFPITVTHLKSICKDLELESKIVRTKIKVDKKDMLQLTLMLKEMKVKVNKIEAFLTKSFDGEFTDFKV